MCHHHFVLFFWAPGELPELRANFEVALSKFQQLKDRKGDEDFEDDAADLLQTIDDAMLALQAVGDSRGGGSRGEREEEALFLRHDLHNLSYDIETILVEFRRARESSLSAQQLLQPGQVVVDFPVSPDATAAPIPVSSDPWKDHVQILELADSAEYTEELVDRPAGCEIEEDRTIHSFGAGSTNIDDDDEGANINIISSTPEAQKYFDGATRDLEVREKATTVDIGEAVPPNATDLRVKPVKDVESHIQIDSLDRLPVLEVKSVEIGHPAIQLPFSSYEALYDSSRMEHVLADPGMRAEELTFQDRDHREVPPPGGTSSFENIYVAPPPVDASAAPADGPGHQAGRAVLPDIRWSAPVDDVLVGPFGVEETRRRLSDQLTFSADLKEGGEDEDFSVPATGQEMSFCLVSVRCPVTTRALNFQINDLTSTCANRSTRLVNMLFFLLYIFLSFSFPPLTHSTAPHSSSSPAPIQQEHHHDPHLDPTPPESPIPDQPVPAESSKSSLESSRSSSRAECHHADAVDEDLDNEMVIKDVTDQDVSSQDQAHGEEMESIQEESDQSSDHDSCQGDGDKPGQQQQQQQEEAGLPPDNDNLAPQNLLPPHLSGHLPSTASMQVNVPSEAEFVTMEDTLDDKTEEFSMDTSHHHQETQEESDESSDQDNPQEDGDEPVQQQQQQQEKAGLPPDTTEEGSPQNLLPPHLSGHLPSTVSMQVNVPSEAEFVTMEDTLEDKAEEFSVDTSHHHQGIEFVVTDEAAAAAAPGVPDKDGEDIKELEGGDDGEDSKDPILTPHPDLPKPRGSRSDSTSSSKSSLTSEPKDQQEILVPAGTPKDFIFGHTSLLLLG